MDDCKSDSSLSELESACNEKLSKGARNGSNLASIIPCHKTPNGVKNERLTPDTSMSVTADLHNTLQNLRSQKSSNFTPSPSASPKSQTSNRTRTPSLSGTPPHPGFTSPISLPTGCFSPASAALGGNC